MHFPDASLIIALASAALAIFVHWRVRQQLRAHRTEAQQWQAEAHRALEALHVLATTARCERDHLESVLCRLEQLRPAASHNTLTAIEHLADPAALADANNIADLAAHLPATPHTVSPDPFTENTTSLAVAHLADQGHTPSYISSHLGLPLGHVELLLSLRSAS